MPSACGFEPAASRLGPLLLGVGLFVVYTANGRSLGAGDTVPATYLSVALVRGDGPWLDRFDGLVRDPDGRLPGFAVDAKGHAVSRYPIGPALIAAPLVASQVVWLDWTRPGWESDAAFDTKTACARLAKNAAAAIVALTAALNILMLRRLGLGRVAPAAAIIVALGSDAWSTASQALWQHGPAALCLSLAMLHLIQPATTRRLALAGCAAALMVVCRPLDLIFAAALAAWVLAHQPRKLRWAFFLPVFAIAALLIAYHLYFFETLTGGYAAIEKMHPWAHGTKGTWTAPFLEGASGTLFSPSHGLLVFCPWLVPALGLAWVPLRDRNAIEALRDPGARSLVAWLLVALIMNFVLLSKYSCWWAGHCFGPRFWIDANPILVVLLALALDWSRRHCRALLWIFALTFAVAAAQQAIGFLCYPSTWHGSPTNADRDHARLWDWRDSELTRCLREGIRPRAW